MHPFIWSRLTVAYENRGRISLSWPDAVEAGSKTNYKTADIFTGVSPRNFATYVAFTHYVLVPADLTNINIFAYVSGPCGGDTTCRTVMTPQIPFLPQPPPVTLADPFKACG
ncbi:hypothetical protein RF11_04737 [Thelohanellus kitauei]|uniref:Uncharacterized protein n=1 Tax=Thelohanellus kitauei TaxID=669202 RepID=A0A0C2M0E6_THEKT|nr:hypothetical protein RF11_04737 [Thelohanellus kitauei]